MWARILDSVYTKQQDLDKHGTNKKKLAKYIDVHLRLTSKCTKKNTKLLYKMEKNVT
jgi:hypothetical protein